MGGITALGPRSDHSSDVPEPGGGTRPLYRRALRLLTGRRVLFFVITVLLLWLVVVPVGLMIYGSVNTGTPAQPGVFTFSAYGQIFSSGQTYQILLRSMEFGLGSTAISFVLGTAFVWFAVRTDLPGRRLLGYLAIFPAFMPIVLEVVAWQLLLDPTSGLISKTLRAIHLSALIINVNSLAGMIVVAGIVQMPLVYLWLWPVMRAMDPSLEEAATMAKSGRFRVLTTITLPLLLPALGATFLISLLLSLEDIVIPTMIGLPAHVTVLATAIYLAFTAVPLNLQTASVYGVVLLVITAILMYLYRRMTRHSERFAIVRGRGYRPTLFHLGRYRWPCAVVMYLIALLIVVIPVLVLIWTSVTPYLQVPSWSGFHHLTFRWYSALISTPSAMTGLENTLILGVTSAVAVCAIAVVISWMIVRGRGRGRGFLDFISSAPIAIPSLALGLGLLWLYASLPIPVYGTLAVLWVAYVTRFIPYGVRLLTTAIGQVHKELEEAAYVTGSRWGRTMRTIMFPLVGPTFVVALVYTVLRVFQELGASLILSTFGTQPYSVVAYNLWEGGETGVTAAYGVVAIAIVLVLAVIVQRVGRRRAELI